MDGYFKLVNYTPDVLLTREDDCLRHLKIIRFLLQHILEAIDAFYEQKAYEAFDAHVGDAMCQIRALKLLELALQTSAPGQSYINILSQVYEKTKFAITASEAKTIEERRRFKSITLLKFLLSKDIFFDFSEDIEFLVKCYVLSTYKKPFRHFGSRINMLKLRKAIGMGESVLTRFVRFLQVSLAGSSVNYMRTIANDKCIFLEKLIAYDSNGRPILPCYILTGLILKKLKELQANILIVIRDREQAPNLIVLSLIFCYDHESECYYFNDKSPSKSTLYFVLSCYSDKLFLNNREEYKEQITRLGPENIFFYVTAHHAQYSSINLESFNTNTYDSLITYAKKFNSRQLEVYISRLLVDYEHDKIKYMDLLYVNQSHICQVDHVSMGTLITHEKIYKERGFEKLLQKSQGKLDYA